MSLIFQSPSENKQKGVVSTPCSGTDPGNTGYMKVPGIDYVSVLPLAVCS